jgi:cell shape-determining protein MreD
MKKSIAELRRELLNLILFLLITLFCAHLNFEFFGINDTSPEYFVSFIAVILTINLYRLDLIKVFLLGLIADIVVFNLLGSYALIFVVIYGCNYLAHRIMSINSNQQQLILLLCLIQVGFNFSYVTFFYHGDFNFNLLTYLINNFLTTALGIISFYVLRFIKR